MAKSPAFELSLQPAQGCAQLSSGVAAVAGRAFFVSCTGAGNVTVEFSDTTQLTFALPAAGLYEFNWSVIEVLAAGLTATATYWNLY